MENLQRNLEEELAATVPKSARPAKRWTLMIVGEHGRVFSIKRFKGLLLLWVFMLVASVLISAGLYYVVVEKVRENDRLKTSLDAARKHVIAMRHEKDILTARLVVAESRLAQQQMSTSGKTVKPAPASDAARMVAKGQAESKPLPILEKEQLAQKAESKVDLPREPAQTDQAAQSETYAPEPVAIAVNVEALKVVYDVGARMIRAQFKLLNILDHSDPISGYTAIVLKHDAVDPAQWLTLPKLTLKSGRPAGSKRGQYFSIYRFKTVKFKARLRADPKPYHEATVFVYDAEKTLLYEKSFPVEIERLDPAINLQ